MKSISTAKFYKEIMYEAKCTFQEAVDCVLNLEKEGLIEIIAYDSKGVPSVFYRKDNIPKDKDDWDYVEDVEKELGFVKDD